MMDQQEHAKTSPNNFNLNDNIGCIESETETPVNETSLWNTAKKCKSVSLAFSELSFRNSQIVENKHGISDESQDEDIVERTFTKPMHCGTKTGETASSNQLEPNETRTEVWTWEGIKSIGQNLFSKQLYLLFGVPTYRWNDA